MTSTDVEDTGGPRRRIAVIGSGVSGLTAAYVMRDDAHVTLFEARSRLGGHAHTHDVSDGAHEVAVDTGFIVHNDRTYPLLRRLFAELDVEVHPTEMSMSVHCEGCGLEYAGGRGAKGILAQPRRLADPRFWRMLASVKRFQRRALAFLADPDEDLTYGEFLERHRFPDYFVSHYAIPIVSCVWSSGHEDALRYPAAYLFSFLEHHGFLQLSGSPQWFTVAGGSRTYVEKVAKAVGDVRAACAVVSVRRTADGVEITDDSGEVHGFDQVVVATHADQALRLLADPTDDERRVLGAFGYTDNAVTLHRDPSFLPRAPQARSGWNYRMDHCHRRSSRTTVTYWMNRLQGLVTDEPLLVTLNSDDQIDPGSVVERMQYSHPLYDSAAVSAQAELGTLATSTTVYAGAYHGWGFHEDGCRSGVEAARHLGVSW